MKTVSLWLLCCWVVTCCRNKALSVSSNREGEDQLCSPLGQLFVGLTGLKAAECLHCLKEEMYGWVTTLQWSECCPVIAGREEKNSNKLVKRPDAKDTLGKEKNKGWLKCRHKTLGSCCTSQTSLYILASPKLYPAWVFTFKSGKSCSKCFGLCWQSPGQQGVLCVCVGFFGFFFSFLFFFQERSIVPNWAYSFQCSLSHISNYGFFWLCNWLR